MDTPEKLIAASAELTSRLGTLTFGPPVAHLYNPLVYASRPWERYLRESATGQRQVVFLGMNPGPWGMAQTGVPFGEIAAVRDWIGIEEPVAQPHATHPTRPIEGFACTRSEVSGRRLWGLFAQRFASAEAFFADHFVANYCPLSFLAESGRNITPDKLPVAERRPLFDACDAHLATTLAILRPRWIVGIGGFAATRARAVVEGIEAGVTARGEADGARGDADATPHDGERAPAMPTVVQILHPSPASPAANRGWAEAAERQLLAAGVWS